VADTKSRPQTRIKLASDIPRARLCKSSSTLPGFARASEALYFKVLDLLEASLMWSALEASLRISSACATLFAKAPLAARFWSLARIIYEGFSILTFFWFTALTPALGALTNICFEIRVI
jgi:hypothetical protein